MSKPDVLRCVCSSPKPKKVWTSARLCAQASAFPGPKVEAISTTTSAGKPPRRACSRTVSTCGDRPNDHLAEASGWAATAPAGPIPLRSDCVDRAPARSAASADQDPLDTLVSD